MQAAPDPAAADTLTADSAAVDTTSGVAVLAESTEEAAEAVSQGDFSGALGILNDAVVTFAVDHLLPALVIALAFWVVLRVTLRLVRGTLARSRRIDLGVQQLIVRVVRMGIVAIAAVTVFEKLGINVTAIVAGLGIAGIALGFAAQDTVQNLIAGVTILLDRPFHVGDNIELHETFGTVEEITLRTTRVRTLDNQMAILPNANVISDKLINHSMLGALRVVVPFGIAYKEDPAAARRAVLATTKGDKRLHPDYAPHVVVTDLGDSSVNMSLRLFLKDSKLEVPIGFEYTERVFDALRAAGIEIPFPHLQLFVDEAKGLREFPLLGAADRNGPSPDRPLPDTQGDS